MSYFPKYLIDGCAVLVNIYKRYLGVIFFLRPDAQYKADK